MAHILKKHLFSSSRWKIQRSNSHRVLGSRSSFTQESKSWFGISRSWLVLPETSSSLLLLSSFSIAARFSTKSTASSMMASTVQVSNEGHVGIVTLCKPPNAMSQRFWGDFKSAIETHSKDSNIRVVLIRAEGKYFSVGLDLMDSGDVFKSKEGQDVARKAFETLHHVAELQDCFTAMERCPKPVISCIHGACIGGAIDLILASDIRYASKQAWFSIKEVDIGLAADVGTLQRIGKATGNASVVMELAMTARRFDADEALSFGFLSKVFPDNDTMWAYAMNIAKTIAQKSPVAIAGTKANLLYSRDHTVKDSLHYMSVWNAAMLQTEDIPKAAIASLKKKEQPEFSKL